MRVLFLHFGRFNVNSVIQAFHFGDELTARGVEVTLCGVGSTEKIAAIGKPSFDCINYDGLSTKLREWRARPEETMICAWTPREVVRRGTEQAVAALGAPYVVHLEDNEEHLLASAFGVPYERLLGLPPERQDDLARDQLIHPTRYRRLLDGAAGITVITEELNEFNRVGRPHRVVRPGVDTSRFSPEVPPACPREQLGLRRDDFVIVYHGVGHYANHEELFSLYLAVKLLQRRGHPVQLLRLGPTKLGGVDPPTFQALRDGVPDLGDVPWREIPGYLALADAYVQPGAPDDFNRYRLPSKLPEFLAMGRPLVLPRCNLGTELRDGEDALLLREGGALEIVAQVERLLAEPELARRLGAGAREFAERELSWPENAEGLIEFYRELLAAGQPSVAA